MYEELARRHLEKRAHKSDPMLDVLVSLSEPDKSLLAAARQRVSALRNKLNLGKTSSARGSASNALASGHRDEALQAARALQTQQQNRDRDKDTQDDVPWMKRGRDQKQDGETSKRKQKKLDWIQGKRDNNAANKWHRKSRW